ALDAFLQDIKKATWLVGHNIEFDKNIIGAEMIRLNLNPDDLLQVEKLDTGVASTDYCKLSGGIGGRLKMPRLIELHEKLFGDGFADSHDASYDVAATARCFFGLIHQQVIAPADETPVNDIEYEGPNL